MSMIIKKPDFYSCHRCHGTKVEEFDRNRDGGRVWCRKCGGRGYLVAKNASGETPLPRTYKDAVEFLMRIIQEREQIIALCNRHAQPGVNGQTHEVCYRILQILGEREAGK